MKQPNDQMERYVRGKDDMVLTDSGQFSCHMPLKATTRLKYPDSTHPFNSTHLPERKYNNPIRFFIFYFLFLINSVLIVTPKPLELIL